MYGLPKLVSFAGLETNSEQEAFEYLKTLTTEQIILAYIQLKKLIVSCVIDLFFSI